MQEEATKFTFSEATKREIVFIAGGEIGPINNWIMQALQKGINDRVRLFFGANTRSDLNGSKKLQDLSELMDDFSMVTALNCSHPEWEGEVGLITDVLRDELDPDKVSRCFIYGTQVMVEETKETLVSLGIPAEKIDHESFKPTYA